MCFSELYTRCQNISSALATSQITSSILDSEELAELLYIAYNRDEAELLQLSKALDSQYDALYSTGKDVLKKKQEKLDQEISLAAIDMATDSILKADKRKQIEELEIQINKEEKIKQKASELLDNYKDQLDKRVFKYAKEEIENSGSKKEEDKKQLAEGKTKSSQTASPVVRKKIVKKRRAEN